MSTLATSDIQEIFSLNGQGHVFEDWDSLTFQERERLLAQASLVDVANIKSLFSVESSEDPCGLDDLNPVNPIRTVDHGGDPALWEKAKSIGNEFLRSGGLAVYTVAGGQGTRLGFDGPKGMLPVSPVKGKTLFQMFAEKIAFAQKKYGVTIPWVVMTSPANHEQTVAYFSDNNFFDLEVVLTQQEVMPLLDYQGKIVLKSRANIALGPDGHGGTIAALKNKEVLNLLGKYSIKILSYCQVDNPLVRCVDPYFVGFHLMYGSEMSSKMVPKVHPEEKVGLFCLRNDKLCIKEYSILPDHILKQKNQRGGLLYNSGNIAVHLIDLDFILNLDENCLPFYPAKKTIKVDLDGEVERKNIIKYERFIFDALKYACNPIVVETSRSAEFSPVKNAQGTDSLSTCRFDLLRTYSRWLAKAGVEVPLDVDDVPQFPFEISFSFADTESQFVEAWNRLPKAPVVQENVYIT